jgi:hypothetical protein
MDRKLIGAAVLCTAVAVGGVASAATTPPRKATINAVSSTEVKVNRYIKDKMRWQKDVYEVRSGGTLHVVNLAPDSGPHTFTVVKKSDLPTTPRAIFQCKICETLGQAHGADPNSDAPPQHLFLEDGVGQDTPPKVNKPGDSAFIEAKRKAHVDLTVTAKKGKELSFICLVHPWMQAKVLVR